MGRAAALRLSRDARLLHGETVDRKRLPIGSLVGRRAAGSLERTDPQRDGPDHGSGTALIDIEARRTAEERCGKEQRMEPCRPRSSRGLYRNAEGVIEQYNRRRSSSGDTLPNSGEKFCGSFKLFYPDGQAMAHRDVPWREFYEVKTSIHPTSRLSSNNAPRAATSIVNPQALTDKDGNCRRNNCFTISLTEACGGSALGIATAPRLAQEAGNVGIGDWNAATGERSGRKRPGKCMVTRTGVRRLRTVSGARICIRRIVRACWQT